MMTAEPEASPITYTVREAAALLKIHPQTLQRLVSERKVPHSKPRGVGIRFTAEHIRKIMAEGERPVVKR